MYPSIAAYTIFLNVRVFVITLYKLTRSLCESPHPLGPKDT